MANKSEKVNPEKVYGNAEPLDAVEEMAVFDFNDPRIESGKISLHIIGCRPDLVKFAPGQLAAMNVAIVEGSNNVIPQARVYGQIIGISDFKKYKPLDEGSTAGTFGILGIHEAVNLLTGEFYKAGLMYLPENFQALRLAEVQSWLETRQPGDNFEYAWEFQAEPAKNPSEYSWRCINLMPMRRTDPLASLRRRALAGSQVQTPLLLQQQPGNGDGGQLALGGAGISEAVTIDN